MIDNLIGGLALLALIAAVVLAILVGGLCYWLGRRSRQKEVDKYEELLTLATKQTAAAEHRRQAAISSLARAIEVIDMLDVTAAGKPWPAGLEEAVQEHLGRSTDGTVDGSLKK